MEGYVSMSAIDRCNCKACVTSHCSVNSTLGQKRAIHVVGCIARNSPDHVSRICHTTKFIKRKIDYLEYTAMFRKGLQTSAPTYVFEVDGRLLLSNLLLFGEVILKFIILDVMYMDSGQGQVSYILLDPLYLNLLF